MRKKVVIIGHGFTSRLCVIRSIAKVDCDITVIVITNRKKANKPIDCYSKYVNRVLFCPSDEKMLIDMLLKQCLDKDQKTILFPDSDFSAVVISKNEDRLGNYFLFPMN